MINSSPGLLGNDIVLQEAVAAFFTPRGEAEINYEAEEENIGHSFPI